jgi:hypothetical protein
MILNKPISFKLQQLLKDKSDEFDVISTLDYPTIATVLDWLYEKHDICIFVDIVDKNIFRYNFKIFYDKRLIKIDEFAKTSNQFNTPITYAEIFEPVIEHCLIKLIKK